jgi:hypothetical protein
MKLMPVLNVWMNRRKSHERQVERGIVPESVGE